MCTMQQSMILFVFSVFLIKSGYGCAPCICYISTQDPWKYLQLAECKKELQLTEIPVTLNQDIQALSFEWQTLSHIHENQFVKFNKLQIMYLRNNKMKYVERHALKNLSSLKIMSLSENEITKLPTDIFQDTPNLITFWMNNNNITILQKNLFSNLKYLTSVYFNKNNIMVVEYGCFSNLPALETLEFTKNKLKTIQLDTENDFKKLKNVMIGGNPWKCEETCEFIHTVVTRKMITGDAPTCETPRQVKDKQWGQLSKQDFAPSIALDANVEDGGTNIILRCSHCLSANLTWLFNHNKHFSNNPLILNKANQENIGQYTCVVQNCAECDTASVTLNETYSNSVEKLTHPTNKTLNERIQLTEEVAKDLGCICMNWITIIIIAVTVVGIIILALTLMTCYYRRKNNKFQIQNEEEQNRKL